MSSYLVVDIETVPVSKARLESYIATFEPELLVEEEPEWVDVEEEPKKKKKPKKPKPKVGSKSAKGGLHYLTGQICAFGIKPIDEEPVVFADVDESVVLVGAYDYLASKYPYNTIGYNTSDFDFPMIRLRGLLHGLDFSGLLPMDKFNKTNIDIYTILGGKWAMPAKLSELCWHFGIEDIEDSGANVAKLFEEGNIAQIASHCRGDIISTEKLYKRLFPGNRRVKKY